jgi:hypothetical protein
VTARLAVLPFIAAAALFADDYAPVGIVRGRLEDALPARTGDLRLRTSGDQVYTCRYDASTYMERDGHRIDAPALRAGDPVEVLTDRKPSVLCYARTVRVREQKAGVPIRARNSMLEAWYPRGNMAFAAVVLRSNPELIVVRVRGGEQKLVRVRPDTRYASNGLPSNLAQLPPNTRVFIRAGLNIERELEAYQVVWGRIEGP